MQVLEVQVLKISGPSTTSCSYAFFRKGRVFTTLWAEVDPRGITFSGLATFVVIKSRSLFSVCLRIVQAIYGVEMTDNELLPIVTVDSTQFTHSTLWGTNHKFIVIQFKNRGALFDHLSHINIARPYTVRQKARVYNVGKVLAPSIGLLDNALAESLNYTKF